jgi:hypothetical protein
MKPTHRYDTKAYHDYYIHHFHIDFMIDFIETHVEFILEFLHVLFPLDGESFWPRNSTHPVTRPNAFEKAHEGTQE